MIAVLLVAENTSELVLIIIHLSGFFFFFTMVCAIFSLLRRIFDSCHSRVILSIFSLCLQVFYLVSFVSTKRMHRGTYIFEVYKAVLWFTLMEIFVCIFSIRTCLRVMCQRKLDLSWAFTLKANVICDVLQNTVITFLWFIYVKVFLLLLDVSIKWNTTIFWLIYF